MVGRESDADARSNVKRCRLERKWHFQRLSDALRNICGLCEVTILKNDGELVATETSDDITDPDDPVQSRPDLLEDGIAGGMTEGVIDLLEMVQVDHQQGKVCVRRVRGYRIETTLEFV